ncbi:MAG TPA: 4-hydroxy-3-methylbut-2-enyl diphosphate reductase, partial [Bacteroidia bacterium]|nr:4-hydroxy-3-methylbut-2-enyl diphosphate reductase [Bacteroidia bacterium]
ISHNDLENLHDCKVLIRAHGEPPSTYQTALKNNIELIDASCPVVLKLQNRVRTSFDSFDDADGQIVIYGEEGHAEVNGLVGQTKGQAIIVRTEADLEKVDFKQPIHFFSQTTKSSAGFKKMKELIEARVIESKGALTDENLEANDTLCRQVSNREPRMQRFSQEHDVVVFVSGKKSSNGKALYSVCKSVNERSYFISEPNELNASWFVETDSVGICGATSTPMWLMQDVADKLKLLFVVETA